VKDLFVCVKWIVCMKWIVCVKWIARANNVWKVRENGSRGHPMVEIACMHMILLRFVSARLIAQLSKNLDR